MTSFERQYAGKRVLVTGGLGFIGSRLALRLAACDARVMVADPCVPGCGGNPKNLAGAQRPIHMISIDIGSASFPVQEVREAEVIFNLAGEVSHAASMHDPERDLNINTTSQLRFLQTVARANGGVRVVYAGTRQVYGKPRYLPVDEEHGVDPVDFNGVHKYAATMYHLMLSRIGLLDACVLRLTNVYGPHLSLESPDQGVFAAFLRRLVRGEQIEVFGDGSQVRDPVYVEDVVDAFLMAGVSALGSRSYNIGGPCALPLKEIAAIASAAAGVEAPVFRAFPPAAQQIDIGSYAADWRRIHDELGWKPRTEFAEGIARTLAWYRVPAGASA